MIHSAYDKSYVMVKPSSVATNATATGTVDCLGFDFARIDVILDSQTSTTSKPAVLHLSEGDTTSSFVTISPFTGGTGFTIPGANSVTPTVIRFNVDLKARKRYLKVTLTSGDVAQISCVHATLSRAEQRADSATLAGCTALVNG